MMTEYMPNPNGSQTPRVPQPQCRGHMALPPRAPSPRPFCYGPIHLKRPPTMPRSCSSDYLSEEPPPWFEDLLNEPESPVTKAHHQRSASDSSAHLPIGGPALNFQMPRHCFNGMARGPGFRQHQVKLRVSTSNCPKLPNGLINAKEDADCQALGMTCSPESDRVKLARSENETQGVNTAFKSDTALKGGEGSLKKSAPSSNMNPDAKRKQHNARRSRVRKLQYIAELERNAQVLQVAGAEVSKQLEYFDQQNLILGMENRALKQRLESLSQEHYIKTMEHEMLDKELGRLRYLYQVQQNMNPHQHGYRQKPNPAVHRRGRSVNDLDPRLARLGFHPPPRAVAPNYFPLL